MTLKYTDSWNMVINVKQALYSFNRVAYQAMLIYVQVGSGCLGM